MSAIDNLKTAQDLESTTIAEGFALIEGAFTELASDIKNIPSADDVQAAADRATANANTLKDAFATFSKTIKDALPTEPVSES